MKIYDYTNIEKCLVTKSKDFAAKNVFRDITERFKIEEKYRDKKLENSVIIICENIYFQDKGRDYYLNKLKDYNKLLQEHNCYVLFTRGRDNPIYHMGDDTSINLSNIKTVDDCCIVKFKGYAVLCIGGSISEDRKWKIKYGEYLHRKLYWEDEKIQLDMNDIKNALNENTITCVITSASPSFCEPTMYGFGPWVQNDENLRNDLIEERKTVESLYDLFNKMNKKPIIWILTKNDSQMCGFSRDIYFALVREYEYQNVLEIARDIPKRKDLLTSLADDETALFGESSIPGSRFYHFEADLI